VARRFVRFAANATKNAISAPPGQHPQAVARKAIAAAARKTAPGLYRGRRPRPRGGAGGGACPVCGPATAAIAAPGTNGAGMATNGGGAMGGGAGAMGADPTGGMGAAGGAAGDMGGEPDSGSAAAGASSVGSSGRGGRRGQWVRTRRGQITLFGV
jgi:hypothetical protein